MPSALGSPASSSQPARQVGGIGASRTVAVELLRAPVRHDGAHAGARAPEQLPVPYAAPKRSTVAVDCPRLRLLRIGQGDPVEGDITDLPSMVVGGIAGIPRSGVPASNSYTLHRVVGRRHRSEEHTSELQSRLH